MNTDARGFIRVHPCSSVVNFFNGLLASIKAGFGGL